MTPSSVTQEQHPSVSENGFLKMKTQFVKSPMLEVDVAFTWYGMYGTGLKYSHIQDIVVYPSITADEEHPCFQVLPHY